MLLSRNLIKKSAAESLGVFLLLSGVTLAPGPISATLIVGALVAATGHVSGAHLNPAVTVAFAMVRRFPWREVPSYLLGQSLGAGLAWLIHGAPGATSAPPAAEATGSLMLMFVITSVATDSRAKGPLAAAAIAAAVGAGAALGAGMNPLRMAAQAGSPAGLLLLTLSFLGVVLGALAYEAVRCEPLSEDTDPPLQAKGCC